MEDSSKMGMVTELVMRRDLEQDWGKMVLMEEASKVEMASMERMVSMEVWEEA